MNVFSNIAYISLKRVDKSEFGRYTSNTSLRNFLDKKYAANPNSFVIKENCAYMRLDIKNDTQDEIFAYFVRSPTDNSYEWELRGSRTEKDLLVELSGNADKNDALSLMCDVDVYPEESPDDIPARNKSKGLVFDPERRKPENPVKEISSFEMISVIGKGDIQSFQIAKYVVSQRLYEEIMNKNPSHFGDGQEAPSRPVENVSWEEAVEFCNVLSENHGLRKVYIKNDTGWAIEPDADGYRLPTRKEWQFAANGGDFTSPFKFSGSDKIQQVAWWQGDDPTATHIVGDASRKKPNSLGLYDMSGNVWEWCWDSIGEYHVCCGGAYNSTEEELTLSSIKNVKQEPPLVKRQDIGFRLVRSKTGE